MDNYFLALLKNTRRQLAITFEEFMEFSILLPIDFFKWKLYDIITRAKPEQKELFGLRIFVGLPGQGKTMSLARKLSYLRQKYKNSIYIYTNFGWKWEDDPFTDWSMLLKKYDKPVVFGFDEIQNDFQSRDFGTFPKPLITAITQFRKGNGIAIYGTTQVFTNIDVILRTQTFEVIQCSTKFGRLTFNKHYLPEDYELFMQTKGLDNQLKIKPEKFIAYIQTNRLRNQYDTKQFLESALKRMTQGVDAAPGEAGAAAT